MFFIMETLILAMVSLERAIELRAPPCRKPGYFRSGALVLTDTLANKVYGLDAGGVSKPAEEARASHPRLAKGVEISAKYAFWIGTAFIGAGISHHTGPAVGYTAAYAHPFLIGAAVKAAKSGLPAMDIRKPGLGTFLASFGLVELASTPLFISAMERLSRLGSTLSPAVAGLAVAGASVISAAFEYACFRSIWKGVVLRGREWGSLRDEARGFLAELDPTKILRQGGKGGPAANAGEYAGQLWGIVESLWLWVQVAAVATAAAIAHFHLATHDDFIDSFFQHSALWGKKFLEVAALARCCVLVEAKTKENNGSLGIK